MSDYISRDELIEKIRYEGIYGSGYSDKEREDDVVDMIESIPAANVKPVVRGKWKLLDGGKGQCSECQSVFKDVWDYDKSDSFCRVCGADMREEEK